MRNKLGKTKASFFYLFLSIRIDDMAFKTNTMHFGRWWIKISAKNNYAVISLAIIPFVVTNTKKHCLNAIYNHIGGKAFLNNLKITRQSIVLPFLKQIFLDGRHPVKVSF